MKAIPSLVSFIPALVFASMTQQVYGAEARAAMSVTSFAKVCADTVLAYREGKTIPRDLRLLAPDGTISVGKEHYSVSIFKLIDGQIRGRGFVQTPPAGQTIVGLIAKAPGGGEETPHFKAICLAGVPHPSATGNDGEIEFKTADNITNIAFRLNKIAGDPERLDKSSWKARAHKEDNIFLVGPFAHNATHPYPDSHSTWPTCMPPKNIDWDGGATVSFAFHDCSPATSNQHDYAYSVHMDRLNAAGVLEDFPLDPLIINHP
jgi:hypothetical protein